MTKGAICASSSHPPTFREVMRFGDMTVNYHKDSAEQLRRNRANDE